MAWLSAASPSAATAYFGYFSRILGGWRLYLSLSSCGWRIGGSAYNL